MSINNFSVSIILFILLAVAVLAIAVIIPVLIGVYVYRDAKSLNLNAVMWTLIAVLVPGYIGLIAYLIVRSQSSHYNCPTCNASIQPEFVVCPNCGSRLKANCENCGKPVDSTWQNCPHCGTAIPEELRTVSTVTIQKKSLPKGLIVVIIIPLVFLIISLIAGITLFAVRTTRSVSQEKYFEYNVAPDKQIN